MCALLAHDCRRYGAVLHSFCVMEHHVHAVLRAPFDHADAWLLQRIKSNSAKLLMPLLKPAELTRLKEFQTPRRSFWQDSFRGIMVTSEETMWDCVKYIHLNPVRSGHVEAIERYRWSSGWMYEQELWTEEDGVTGGTCLAFPEPLSFK